MGRVRRIQDGTGCELTSALRQAEESFRVEDAVANGDYQEIGKDDNERSRR